jgi:hypothetical protein
MIKAGTFHVVTLAPCDPGPRVTRQIDAGGEQILAIAGIVRVIKICDPTVGATVASGKGHEVRKSPLPFILDTRMGETTVIGFKVTGVNDLGS